MILKKICMLRSVFDSFLKKFKYCYYSSNSFLFYNHLNLVKKSFMVKGMGYRIFYKRFGTVFIFFFELGFSHFMIYKINANVVYPKVNKMCFDLLSLNHEYMGNLSALLVKFVSDHVYSFKGVFFSNQSFRVKMGKKK